MNVKPPCISRLDLGKLIFGSLLETGAFSKKHGEKNASLYLLYFYEFKVFKALEMMPSILRNFENDESQRVSNLYIHVGSRLLIILSKSQ